MPATNVFWLQYLVDICLTEVRSDRTGVFVLGGVLPLPVVVAARDHPVKRPPAPSLHPVTPCLPACRRRGGLPARRTWLSCGPSSAACCPTPPVPNCCLTTFCGRGWSSRTERTIPGV